MLASPGQIAAFVDQVEALNGRRLSSYVRHAAQSVIARRGFILNPRGGAIVAASAFTAAAAWREIEHRRITRADLGPSHIRITSLSDLRLDQDSRTTIEYELAREWGAFSFVGFSNFQDMSLEAGRMIFIASPLVDGRYRAKAVLQTTLVDVGGDPSRLRDLYPTFNDLVSAAVWRRARAHGGDTAVLLQITVLDPSERGGGLGSVLRNAALHMLPDRVKFALTTTPIDAANGAAAAALEFADPGTFTAAMKFHARGGAAPALVVPGFKTPPAEFSSAHGHDIVFMRYVRADDGVWPTPKPEMRLHSTGPIEDTFLRTARRLRAFRPPRSRMSSLAPEPV